MKEMQNQRKNDDSVVERKKERKKGRKRIEREGMTIRHNGSRSYDSR